MTGTSCSPTRCAARQRRSPATSSKSASSPASGRTSKRLEDALLADRLGERVELGLGKAPPRLECPGADQLDRHAALRRADRPGAPLSASPNSAARPRPSWRRARPLAHRAAAVAAAQHLGGEPDIGLRRRRSHGRRSAPACRATAPRRSRTLRGIIVSNTLAPKWPRTSAATWSQRLLRWSYIVSTHALQLEPRIERALHPLDRAHQLAQPFERIEFALQRHQHRIGGDQRIDRQQVQRRRAVDQHLVIVAHPAADRPAQQKFAPLARRPIPARRRPDPATPGRSTAAGCRSLRPPDRVRPRRGSARSSSPLAPCARRRARCWHCLADRGR